MNALDKVVGNWIQIRDYNTELSIDCYGYDTGVIEGTTDNHCVKCVAINKCWFKNEEGKRPPKFDYSEIDVKDFVSRGLKYGMHHPNCHCVDVPVYPSSPEEIEIIIPNGKISYLFKTKGGWVEAMGYGKDFYDKFVDVLLQKVKEAYFYGNYYFENLSHYGFKANMKVDLPGANEKKGRVYKLESNYMIFPNGKLKMNTPIGGWQNENA